VIAVKKSIFAALGAIGFALAIMAAPAATASADQVKSLRGSVAVDEADQAPDIHDPSAGKRFERAFRQQPPLIPHKIDKYEIDMKVNQCMRCHDWPYNVKENAPKISETHYRNREGTALDVLSRNRWFCTQCHVPQTDALPLVDNSFQPTADRR
jgi:cytochrome c-type protein NapB